METGSMSRDLKIMLTEDQCDALAEEARAAGLKFFDHCRAKLLAGLAQPVQIVSVGAVTRTGNEQPYGRSPAMDALARPDDRLDRLEAMIMQLADAIQGQPIAQPMAADSNIDVDDVISGALSNADQQMLVQPELPQESVGVRHVGTRPPAPYSGRQMPRHLQNLLPGG
jgi:hypothetical protein